MSHDQSQQGWRPHTFTDLSLFHSYSDLGLQTQQHVHTRGARVFSSVNDSTLFCCSVALLQLSHTNVVLQHTLPTVLIEYFISSKHNPFPNYFVVLLSQFVSFYTCTVPEYSTSIPVYLMSIYF